MLVVVIFIYTSLSGYFISINEALSKKIVTEYQRYAIKIDGAINGTILFLIVLITIAFWISDTTLNQAGPYIILGVSVLAIQIPRLIIGKVDNPNSNGFSLGITILILMKLFAIMCYWPVILPMVEGKPY
ncbi:hypothetical protein DC094_19610 [Pelagibaculum spongiae]|uniref:Uncharacterized protein n=2 Tax=Pelagibaculum spongiae TaxID=2080658 RepID=A0A2V1GW25_9GAMM|nr:hypothetical protein DC094_19610 [Pelagibaculum spongiae]